jgi:hypothetical protein
LHLHVRTMSGESQDLVHIIQAEFVDRRKLMQLLREVYGETDGRNNFRVEVCII